MASGAQPAVVSQAEFARMREVSRKTVTVWKQRGHLVLDANGLVDVAGTDARLADRADVTRAPVTPTDKVTPKRKAKPAPIDAATASVATALDRSPEEIASALGWSTAEAQRVKEIYLALLRKQEFEEADKQLVDAATVRRQVFEVARLERDAWLGWPSRVSALIAAEIGADQATLAIALEKHVREQLAGRAEPNLRVTRT